VGALPANGRFAVEKRQFEPALIVEKYFAHVKQCTFEMSTTGQIAAQ
jgi:hypothetical protein